MSKFDRLYGDPLESGPLLVSAMQEKLQTCATEHGVPFQELASTLLFACVRRSSRSLAYIVGHLGDGVIGIRVNGITRVLSTPDNGEFANSTTFMTSHQAPTALRMHTGRVNESIGFILMSDGAADTLYMRRKSALAEGCDILLDAFEQLPQKTAIRTLETNVGFLAEATRTGDDCALAVLSAGGCQRPRRRL